MGRKKEQRKVKLTIEENETSTGYNYGYVKDYIGSLDVLPYWGSKVTVIRVFQCRQNQDTHFYLTDRSVPKVTAHVKGYSKTITTNVEELGDIYSMYSSNGDVRYLTFDPPPPTVTWIQRHSNRSKVLLKEVLRRRRRSLGGSRC